MANILLLEDDPPTSLFLHEALRALPAQVHDTGTLAQAQAAVGSSAFDVWLFDANLPDGHSADLLARLRLADAHCPAIALTADNDANTVATLLAAGFARVLNKPVSVADLLRTVRELLSLQPEATRANNVWNHRHALAAAGGVEGTRAALNALFLQELPGLQHQIIAALAQGRHTQAAGLLHRLKGSCALVGAEALRDAVFALARDPGQSALHERFVNACQRTLREKS